MAATPNYIILLSKVFSEMMIVMGVLRNRQLFWLWYLEWLLKILESFVFIKYTQWQCILRFAKSTAIYKDLKPYTLEGFEPGIFWSGCGRDDHYSRASWNAFVFAGFLTKLVHLFNYLKCLFNSFFKSNNYFFYLSILFCLWRAQFRSRLRHSRYKYEWKLDLKRDTFSFFLEKLVERKWLPDFSWYIIPKCGGMYQTTA
jgi:hypothetical protein